MCQVSKLSFEDQRRAALMAKQIVFVIKETYWQKMSRQQFSVKDDLFVPCVEPKHPFYREQHETFDLDKYMYPECLLS